MKKKIYFHRHLRRFSGGHLKMYDYFCHVLASSAFEPRIFFTKASVWTDENPWRNAREYVSQQWPPREGEILLLGNMSWRFLPEHLHPKYPIINLVQGVHCATPSHPHYETLSYPATRICVSVDIANAIRSTGRANGPIHVIQAGVDQSLLPVVKAWDKRSNDIVIVGYKRPDLAVGAFKKLKALVSNDTRILLLDTALDRSAFLDLLADTRVAVTLPKLLEGFYLPALEAMLLGCLTVCPDAIGNRGFCKPGITCWTPVATPFAIAQAAIEALALGDPERITFNQRAHQVASLFSIDRERCAFHEILGSWPS